MDLQEEDVASLQVIMKQYDYTSNKIGRVRTKDLLDILRLAGKNPANDEVSALTDMADPDG